MNVSTRFIRRLSLTAVLIQALRRAARINPVSAMRI